MSKVKLNIIKCTIALLAFAVWTIVVCTCDVQLDSTGHGIGLATMNLAISNSIAKPNELCKLWADIFLILALVGLGGLALIGIVKIIRTKSLSSVMPLLYGTLVVGIFWVICYLMFDKVAIINYAPDTTHGLKSSYPSTHVVCCIFAISILIRYSRSHGMNNKLTVACYAFEVLFVGGVAVMKLFAKEHYFSDLIGGAFLGIFYVYLVDLWVACFEEKAAKLQNKESK